MNYATPKADLIYFEKADVMIYSEDREHGETPPTMPGVKTEELTIRDIGNI